MVETLGVRAWYVEENESRPLPDSFSGQFHTADTYVVCWKYKAGLLYVHSVFRSQKGSEVDLKFLKNGRKNSRSCLQIWVPLGSDGF